MGLLTEIVFFDLNTMAVRVCLRNSANPVVELGIDSATIGVLKALKARGARVGVTYTVPAVSPPAVAEALERAGVARYFDADLIFAGGKDSPAWRAAAAAFSPGAGTMLLFVTASEFERRDALNGGHPAAPHPLLAEASLRESDSLRYLCIRVPPPAASSPFSSSNVEGGWVASLCRALQAMLSRFLRHLTAPREGEDAASLRAGEEWRAVLRDRPVVPLYVAAECDGAAIDTVYAISGTATAAELDDLGFRVDRLGGDDLPRTTRLYLKRDDRHASGFLNRAGNSSRLFSRRPHADLLLATLPEGLLLAFPPEISPEDLFPEKTAEAHVASLAPSPSLLETPAAGAEAEITKILEAARIVLADLSGPTVKILEAVAEPEIKRTVARYSSDEVAVCGDKLIRSRHARHPDNPNAVCAILEDLARIGGGELKLCTVPFTFDGGSRDNVEATLPARVAEGEKAKEGVVLIGAHLDSTADCTSRDVAANRAPGANDNASGMAGVLCAASAILELDRVLNVPRREIRFVLFNAEEIYRTGSEEYAAKHTGVQANAMVVFVMDMIGGKPASGRRFEMHTGHPGSAVHDPSRLLAELVEVAAGRVSARLDPPSMFHGKTDPARDLSDHAPFRKRRIAACLASQSLFPPRCGTGTYHTTKDLPDGVDGGYAADIARAVAAAAWAVAIA